MKIISLEQALELGLDTVHIFKHNGFGDAVMLGAAARELVRRTDRPVLIGTKPKNYELLIGIDDGLPAAIYILEDYYSFIVNKASVRRMAARGIRVNYFMQSHMGAILPEIAGGMNIADAGGGGRNSADLSLYMRAGNSAADFGVPGGQPFITVMAGGKMRKAVPNRILQSVVDKYKSKYNFVQVGTAADPLLNDVVDMRGRLSLGHGVPTVIGNSVLFIGAEGTLMHIAAATQTRAVIGDGWMGLLTQNAGAVHIIPRGTIDDGKDDSQGDMDTLDAGEFMNAVGMQLKEIGKPFPKNIIDLADAKAHRPRINYDSLIVNYIILALKAADGFLRGRKNRAAVFAEILRQKLKYGLSL